jgi:hypothetical protein
MKYLVTGYFEYYQYVNASSEEEARSKIDKFGWYQTINHPIQNVQVKPVEIETTGEEV